MRACVLGNSHLGMLAAAFNEAPPENTELVFCGKPGLVSSDFDLKGTILSAGTAGLRDHFEKLNTPEHLALSEFDMIVFVGLTASVYDVSGLVSAHRVSGWPRTEELLRKNDGNNSDSLPLLTQSALLDSLIEITKTRTTFELLRRLREVTDIPAFIVPQPYPSTRVLRPGNKHPTFKRIYRDGDGAHAVAALVQSYETAFGGIGDTRLLVQSPRTVSHSFLTRRRFSRNSVRINHEAKQSPDDVLHANANFGRTVMNRLFEDSGENPTLE